jgi:hypothetical protein
MRGLSPIHVKYREVEGYQSTPNKEKILDATTDTPLPPPGKGAQRERKAMADD